MNSYFLVSSYTNNDILAHTPLGKKGEGITLLEYNNNTNILKKLWSLDLDDNIAFLLQNENLIYASTEKINLDGEILVLSIDKNGAKLLDKKSSCGKSTCYLNIHNNSLSAVNYWDSKLVTYGLNEKGTFSVLQQIKIQSDYVEKNKPTREEHWMFRQKWSHNHCMVTEPYNNNYHYVIDLGNNLIRHLVHDSETCQLIETKQTLLESGSGPRHLVFHPEKKLAYIINELISTVSIFLYENDSFTFEKTFSTLPEDYQNELVNNSGAWKAKSHASEIRILNNKLFVSNRGHNSIVIYDINEDGLLYNPKWINSGGDTPRNFNFSLDNNLLLVGNQNSDECSLFDVSTNKFLTSIELNSPNYIIPINLL
jgi:6-phosphogluconolactonase